MRNRLKSPVVWGVTLSVVVTQIEQLKNMPNLTGWDIAITVGTILIALFGALNNPTDNSHF